jgi:predicted nucleic acid-binding protein
VTHFVLDASIVLTWCFPDEEAQKAERISERIALGDEPTVPAFWRHEVLNALLVGENRTRLTSELIQTFIEDLERLPTEIDSPLAGTVFHTTQDLCRKHGLTAYDAAYLELAMRNRIALATADGALERAARAEGIEIV